MSEKKVTEAEMNALLDEDVDETKKSEAELLEQQTADKRPIDEVPKGVHPLVNAIQMDNQQITEIEYDLDCLTPIQYINLVKRLSKKKQIPVPEVDMEVQISYFALASGIPVTILKGQMSTSDYTQVCGLVRTFLLGASVEDLEE